MRTDVVLAIDDRALPANTGTWRLAIADGVGQAVPAPGAAPAAHLGAPGLAALYAGTPAATLRLTGLLTGGDPPTDAVLDAAFACRAHSLDTF